MTPSAVCVKMAKIDERKKAQQKFVICMAIFQLIVVILYCSFVRYEESLDVRYYARFMDFILKYIHILFKLGMARNRLIKAKMLSWTTNITVSLFFIFICTLLNMVWISVITDIQVMLFVGFGFLMTFLRRFGYSAVSFTLLLTVMSVEYAVLVKGFM